MVKQLQCYHPAIGDEVVPSFVFYGTANEEVDELYCGLFRDDDWYQGTPLHPAGDQSLWAFEFAIPIPAGGGYSLWLGELTDMMPMLQLYPLTVLPVMTAGLQLVVKHPPEDHLVGANFVLSYGNSVTPLDRHVIDIEGVETAGVALRNGAGRWVVRWSGLAVEGVVPATLKFRNTDSPMPSQAQRAIRLREV